jgi:hypothetical protein
MKISRMRAAVAAALLSFSLAAPAFADRGWDDDDDWRHRRGYPVHEHGRHCDRGHGHGHSHGRDYYDDRDRGWGWNHNRGYRYYSDRIHHDADYGCGPCGRRWRSRDKFHRHLSSHHGVPYHAIPRVVVYMDWGWLFRG